MRQGLFPQSLFRGVVVGELDRDLAPCGAGKIVAAAEAQLISRSTGKRIREKAQGGKARRVGHLSTHHQQHANYWPRDHHAFGLWGLLDNPSHVWLVLTVDKHQNERFAWYSRNSGAQKHVSGMSMSNRE